jgi:hypothetical protein
MSVTFPTSTLFMDKKGRPIMLIQSLSDNSVKLGFTRTALEPFRPSWMALIDCPMLQSRAILPLSRDDLAPIGSRSGRSPQFERRGFNKFLVETTCVLVLHLRTMASFSRIIDVVAQGDVVSSMRYLGKCRPFAPRQN